MDKWLTELNEVMEEALDLVSSGELKHVSMYKLAPRLYVNRYNVRSDLMLKRILDEVDEQIKTEWYSDPSSKQQFKFHFVSAYLLCFLVDGKVTCKEYDQVMNYLNKEMDLFEE
ncbi:hypothetical protein BA893_05060 [Vibrio natriegens]|uniref:hypothetical protein n=1 Tax=Vibrio natriegens TaxID=691 RepID=UPI000803C92C|nr:hypothetical protein [Vibrio natriegens]ANQ21063.1 hypothetical protein BA893_05060 [Vibrio natriegens]